MTYWYSPSANSIGLVSWGKKKRPKDAVDVSDQEHAALFPPDQLHREIEAGPDGRPRHKRTSIEDHRRSAIRSVKREAARRIDAVFPIFKQMNTLRSGDAKDKRFIQIDAIRSASDLIELDMMDSENPQDVPVIDHPLWPEQE